MKSIINMNKAALFLAVLLGFSSTALFASSHREAPLIAADPLADNTDVYAFRSPDDTNTVTLIANFIPMQLPHGGPNYYSFGENIRYEIHVDNDVTSTGDDIIYRFTFTRTNEDPTTFFNIRLGKENIKTTYKLEKSTDGGTTFSTIVNNGFVPPYNIGERSIQGAAGLDTTNYEALYNKGVTTATTGEKVFAGPVDDPFFVDLGGIFDLGDAPRQGTGDTSSDGLARLNVHALAIQVPIEDLQKDGDDVTDADNILDGDFVIGVWASASRRTMRTLATGARNYSGGWVQVSRLGMPLTNEVVIPIGMKDYWNTVNPYTGDTAFYKFFNNPELALYMDDEFFAAAVPAFGPLTIQDSSLGVFNFSNQADGLFGLKGSSATTGTALDTAIFGNFLLPAAGMPRSVDLLPIFMTGVPNLAPYQLATGKMKNNPLSAGKPFVNNFLPNGGDMLRLNMATPITERSSTSFSSLGLIQAAVLGLTSPTYNGNANMEFIPNMDGFPNGRRLEDDVTRIELQAVSGIVLAAIGLPYDDYDTATGTYPLSGDLLSVLGYSTGVEMNDTTFRTTFPFMQLPWSGKSAASGPIVPYTQPTVLEPTEFRRKFWTGNVSSDWTVAGNWNPEGVPDTGDEVVIPVRPNMPVLSASGNYGAAELTVNMGAVVRLNNNGDTFNIINNLIMNGELFTDTGVSFAFQFNDDARTVTGMGKTHVGYFIVDADGGVTITSDTFYVRNVMTVVDGDVDMGTKFQFNADENLGLTALLAPLPSGSSVTGSANYQQYMDGDQDWRFISAPTANATLQTLRDDIVLYGFKGAGLNSTTGFSNTYFYNATTGKYFEPQNGLATQLNPGLGVQIFTFYSEDFMDFFGPLTQGTVNFPVAGTSGSFNMLGNPYPAPIDWDAASGWTKSNISPTIYIWDANNNSYSSYNASTNTATSTGSRYIAAAQGFFVAAAGASPVLTSTEPVKVVRQDVEFLQTEEVNVLRLVATNAKGHKAEAVLGMHPEATMGLDFIDAKFLPGSEQLKAVGIFTGPQTNPLLQNYMPVIEKGQTVVIPVRKQGTLDILTLNGLATFPTDVVFTAIELNSGQRIVVQEGQELSLQNGEEWNLEITRAADEVTGVVEAESIELKLYPNPAENVLRIESSIGLQGYEVLNTLGQVEMTNRITSGIRTQLNVNVSALTSGTYLIKVYSDNGSTLRSFVKK